MIEIDLGNTQDSIQEPSAGRLDETGRVSPIQEPAEHEKYLRLLAEFDNYRKRTDKERERFAHLGKRSLILKLIDLADSLDQAMGHIESASGPAEEGLRAIHRQLMTALRSEGVVPFDSLGQPFNPDLHEAVGTEDASAREPGTVLKEFQKGYKWGGEIIRHSRVNVAR